MSAAPQQSSAETGLKTRHVFLDTQVYRQYGHNLNAKVLQSLLKQIKNGVCTLHITDITRMEIRRQLDEMAVDVAQSVNKANKDMRRWKARSVWPAKSEPPAYDVSAKDLAESAIRDFNVGMMMNWEAESHDALNISPKEVFEAYFRRDPPFEKADSKEFPDAFVIAALDQWCTQRNQHMYVVTRDGAMKRAAEKTSTLIPLSSLDELLQIIVQAQDPKILSQDRKSVV